MRGAVLRPQQADEVRTWQKHYRKAFPGFVFFENITGRANKGIEADLVFEGGEQIITGKIVRVLKLN